MLHPGFSQTRPSVYTPPAGQAGTARMETAGINREISVMVGISFVDLCSSKAHCCFAPSNALRLLMQVLLGGITHTPSKRIDGLAAMPTASTSKLQMAMFLFT